MVKTVKKMHERQRRSHLVLVSILVLTVLFYLPVLGKAPIAWMDDAMITDFGRSIIGNNSSTGVNSDEFGSQMMTPFVIAPLYSELAYVVGGHKLIRLSTVIFATISCYLVFLIARLNNSSLVSALLALSLLFSYNFAQNYLSGRFDSLSILFFFLAAYLQLAKPFQSDAIRTILTFFIFGLSVVTWPTSAIFILVLCLFELFGAPSEQPKKLLASQSSFVIFFCALLLIALSASLVLFFNLNFIANILRGHLTHTAPLQELAYSILKLSIFDLPFFAAIIFYLVSGTRNGAVANSIAVASIIALVLLFVAVTSPYVHRYVYLLATVTLLSASYFHLLSPRARTTLGLFFFIFALFGSIVQLGGRNYVSFFQPDRDPSAVAEGLAFVDCADHARAYIQPFHLYYILRDKGCLLDRYTFLDSGVIEEVAKNIESYDYVILYPEELVRLQSITELELEVTAFGTGTQYFQPIVIVSPVGF